MKYFAIIILLSIGACLGNVTKVKTGDDPIINNGTVTDAPVTEIDPPIKPSTPTIPTSSPATSTASTTTTTTPSPPTPLTTTTKPTPQPTPTPTTKPTHSPTTKPTNSPTTKPTSPPISSSTVSPITTTAPSHQERKFDGPSFVGGIILALGLTAIGFVAFKFYKARTEQNYHTL